MVSSKRASSEVRPTSVDDMNAMLLRRSRHKPAVGDLFVLNMLGNRWIAGRVIRMDARAFGEGNPLLYFYRIDITDPERIQTPIAPDLLIPPIITNYLGWRRGFYMHLRNEPLAAEELLSRHVFDNRNVTGKYVDEYNCLAAPPEPGLPCGFFALWSYRAIDDMLSKSLGIPPKQSEEQHSPSTGKRGTAEQEVGLPVARQPDTGEHWVTLHVPTGDSGPGELELNKLENDLTDAVKVAAAGEWEGHGFNLRDHVFDMRFHGPDAAAIVKAMRPALERAGTRLPAGWYLTKRVGDSEREERLDLEGKQR